jgi:hypothetical protein
VTAGSTSTADITGNGYNAAVNGGLTYPVDSTFGTVASLDGSTGFAATSRPVLNTGTNGSFTVSAWVNLKSDTQYATAVARTPRPAIPAVRSIARSS